METSRVNLAALAMALVAVLLVLHLPESQSLLASLVSLALLVALLAFGGQDILRTAPQSLAFAMVCGLAAMGTLAFPIRVVMGASKTIMGQDVIPPVLWLVGTAIFWFIDRAGAPEAGVPKPVSFSGTSYGGGYLEPQAMAAAAAAPTPHPSFTPAPVMSAPAPVAQPVAAPPPPPAPAPITDSNVAATPVPPVLKGKEVTIYVNMVGEGMNVLRSVRAEHLGRDFYIIVDEMPADENWEFMPGQVVRCKKKNLSNGKGMVAYEEAPRAQ